MVPQQKNAVQNRPTEGGYKEQPAQPNVTAIPVVTDSGQDREDDGHAEVRPSV
ncbi:MAG TPA: hypothetical protein PK096_03520 [Candidatus Saccharibacteria bacterium]|nr:hypothetical protein [Candidatus Saccharibacteria bacterium]HRK94413.1 hypothetical protein [Candidatus Saccharibacteria bacterium]